MRGPFWHVWTTFVPCGQRIQFFVRFVKFVGAEKDTKRQGDGSLLNGCLQMRNGSDTILNRDPSIFDFCLSKPRETRPRREEKKFSSITLWIGSCGSKCATSTHQRHLLYYLHEYFLRFVVDPPSTLGGKREEGVAEKEIPQLAIVN